MNERMSLANCAAWVAWALIGAGFVWFQTEDIGQSFMVFVVVVVWWARYEAGYRKGRRAR